MSKAQSQSAGPTWRIAVPWAAEPLTSTGATTARATRGVTTQPWQDWTLGFLLAFFSLLVTANIVIPTPQRPWVQSLFQQPGHAAVYAGIVGGALALAVGAYFGLRRRLPILTRGLAFGITMSVLVQLALLIYWYSLP